MTPAIQAMRDWLRTCPLVASAQEDGVAFRVGGLTGDAEEYTILDMPGAPELKHYFSGSSKVTEKKQNKNIDNATFLLIYNSNHAGSYDSAYSPGSKYRCKKQCSL